MKKDKRIGEILNQIVRFSKYDYGGYLTISENVDEIDAICAGLNELGERLRVQAQEAAEKKTRVESLLDVLVCYQEMNFTPKAPIANASDEVTALGTALNLLGETLANQTIQLSDSETQIKTIFTNAPDAIVVINGNGVIKRWNPAAEKKFGWTKPEAIGKNIHDLLIPERYREQHLAGMARFLETNEGTILNKSIQLPALRKDHTEIEMELTISPARLNEEYLFIAFLRDITERLKIERQIKQLNNTLEQRVIERTEQLKASEYKYRNLFENNPMPLWVLDTKSLCFLDVNDAAIKQYGYSREEFLSMHAASIRPEEDKQRFLQLNRSSNGTENKGVWRHLKKDGTLIYSEVIVHEIEFNGKPARLVLSNDVTARKQMEEQVLELNKNLEDNVIKRTQELQIANQELESFSYSVSHDLRAPLRAINGYAQMVIEDYSSKLDEEGIRFLNIVRSNATKMGQLVDDLLTFSRMGKREMKVTQVNLDILVEDVLNDIYINEKYPGTITIHPLGTAVADPALLHHAFQNLISNAFKYSSKKETPLIEVGIIKKQHLKTYFIKDNGAGFNMRYYDKLFGVFQRLHRDEEFEGTGVGLAIVQRIIQRHGGKIWAEAKEGEGATFYFTLEN